MDDKSASFRKYSHVPFIFLDFFHCGSASPPIISFIDDYHHFSLSSLDSQRSELLIGVDLQRTTSRAMRAVSFQPRLSTALSPVSTGIREDRVLAGRSIAFEGIAVPGRVREISILGLVLLLILAILTD